MSEQVSTGAVHHVTLTVSDIKRSADFYTSYLGFKVVVEFEPRVALSNGSLLLVLSPPPDPAQAISQDRFNENRIGLDHVSFGVGSLVLIGQHLDHVVRQGVVFRELHARGWGVGLAPELNSTLERGRSGPGSGSFTGRSGCGGRSWLAGG